MEGGKLFQIQAMHSVKKWRLTFMRLTFPWTVRAVQQTYSAIFPIRRMRVICICIYVYIYIDTFVFTRWRHEPHTTHYTEGLLSHLQFRRITARKINFVYYGARLVPVLTGAYIPDKKIHTDTSGAP